jgi:hypothetical protein
VSSTYALRETSGDDGSNLSAHDQRVDRWGERTKKAVIAGWCLVAAALLRHREVLSSDTLSNYIHVWFISEQLWHGHGLPYHMPVLASGDALAFPYGLLPWMVAALLWPLLGEWAVGLCIGVGFVAMVWTTFLAFPELKRGWWAVAVLLNPAFFYGLLMGQLPFMWAGALLLGAIAAWRNGKRTLATVLAALAQITHAPILIPLTAITVLVARHYERDAESKRALLRQWLISIVPAIPAALIVFLSPVAIDASRIYTAWIELETLALRSLIVAIPVGLILLQKRDVRRSAPAWAAGVLVAGQLLTIPISGMVVGWGALVREPDPILAAIPHSASFEPGATYRVLTSADAKYGLYSVVRGGGRLDSEFFPESMHRGKFKDEHDYAQFLTRRRVDYVFAQHRYKRFRSNELDLLGELSAPQVGCFDGIEVHTVEAAPTYDLYKVDRGCTR